MAITANRVCGVCGRKIGTLAAVYENFELRDNCYLCTDCRSRCSPFIDGTIMVSWTSDDAQNHMKSLEDMRRKIQTEFRETEAVYSQFGGEKLLALDASHRWFYTPQNPELFSLDQIRTWNVQIDTDVEESGLRIANFTPPRPDMPVPGRLETLTGMEFVIELKNHPYADRMEIRVCGRNNELLKRDVAFFRQAYDTAEALCRLVERYAKKRNTTGIITFYD